jgi:hypothetical protein
MTFVPIILDCLLGVLLVAALMLGMRLDKRLKGLRESHAGFAAAVGDLDRAAARAEQGLADLRAATDEAADVLAARIEKAQILSMKLENIVDRAANAPPPAPARDRQAPPSRESFTRPVTAHPTLVTARSRARVDDDLFAEEAPRLRSTPGAR